MLLDISRSWVQLPPGALFSIYPTTQNHKRKFDFLTRMIGNGVKAKCKNCGCEAPVSDFKLHYEIRQMVCSKCHSNYGKKKVEEKKEAPAKPAGWDAEDEYLSKVSKIRQEENQAQFSKIPGSNQVKCKCNNCRYSFKYDPFRKQPRSCPYCDGDIPKVRTLNLL